MAGLEVIYSCVANSLKSAPDAVVCFVHWEIVKSGYKCLGSGDEARDGEKKSELLPTDWNTNQELYTLRYRSNNDKSNLLLKAILVDSSLIFNVMDSVTGKPLDLTINVSDYVDETNLQSFESFLFVFSVFKNTEELVKKLHSSLLSSTKNESSIKKEKRESSSGERQERNPGTWSDPDHDPLRIPHRVPHATHPPDWPNPMAPFSVGRADLDPFSGRGGGMIMDPLRSGFPRSGFDPSRGIPGVLPPGAVPPGARFDPFGPVGRHARPDPDHLPPPGFDDMFM